MKVFLLLLIFSISNFSLAQNISYANLKSFINNRVNEFEEYYKITSNDIDDKFGNLTIYYTDKKIDNSEFDFIIKTEGKNIVQILVMNKLHKTGFFRTTGLDLENSLKTTKNYKTAYLYLIKKTNKRKTYFDTIDELIEQLKLTDLNEFHGTIESEQLNTFLTINNDETKLLIK